MSYSIRGQDNSRLLSVAGTSLKRYRFKDATGLLPFSRFIKNGSSMVALVQGPLQVYSLPHINNFHYEHLRLNARTLWHSNTTVDEELLLESMLEFIEEL